MVCTSDDYKLWDELNEDTRNWTLGTFKYGFFSPAFDSFTRKQMNFIRFNIKHDGVSYIDKSDNAMPVNVSSGVAYHTQIENDFLRFNLTDSHDRFHSIGLEYQRNFLEATASLRGACCGKRYRACDQ